MSDILADLRLTQPTQIAAPAAPSTIQPHDVDFLSQIGKILKLSGKGAGSSTGGAAESSGGLGDIISAVASILA